MLEPPNLQLSLNKTRSEEDSFLTCGYHEQIKIKHEGNAKGKGNMCAPTPIIKKSK